MSSFGLPDTLGYEEEGGVITVTLNRPEAHNALLLEMVTALKEITADFEQDDAKRVLIVTGAGAKAFCSGGDLKALIPTVTANGARQKNARERTSRFFSDITKPIIAAVNGFAMAGGMEIVLGTDIRVASETASFGLSEPRWALLAAGGGTVRLPQQIPYALAMEMLLTGDRIDAATALRFGLVNRVVAPDALLDTAREIADRIARNGPLAVRKIKETVLKAYGLGWEQAFYLESLAADQVFASADAKEGPKAFAEKRDPNFTGH